jgi:hypothetical protein
LANRGELLLDAGLGHLAADLFDIRGDRQRVDVFQLEPPAFSPVEELFYRPGISAAGVAITNVGGEELDEAQARALITGADGGWQRLDAEPYQRRRRGNLVGQQYLRFRYLGTLLCLIPYYVG